MTDFGYTPKWENTELERTTSEVEARYQGTVSRNVIEKSRTVVLHRGADYVLCSIILVRRHLTGC